MIKIDTCIAKIPTEILPTNAVTVLFFNEMNVLLQLIVGESSKASRQVSEDKVAISQYVFRFHGD